MKMSSSKPKQNFYKLGPIFWSKSHLLNRHFSKYLNLLFLQVVCSFIHYFCTWSGLVYLSFLSVAGSTLLPWQQTFRLCAQSISHLHSDWLELHIKHSTAIYFSKNSCNYRLQLYNFHLWDATSLQAGAAPQAAGCTWSPQGPGWAQWWQAPSHLLKYNHGEETNATSMTP